MATIPIRVPSVGESVTEGILARWLKPDGSAVTKGEPLFELETDKATQPVPAENDGVLKISAPEGSTVEVGSTVGVLDPDASPRPTAKAPPSTVTASPTPAPKVPEPPSDARPAPSPSPAVRRVAAEAQVDLRQVPGTGPGGRVTKGDVLSYLETSAAPAPTTSVPGSVPPAEPTVSTRESRQQLSSIRQRIAKRLVESQQTTATLTTFNEADLSRVMDLRKRYKEEFQKKHGVGLGFMSIFVKASIEALKAFPVVNGRIEGTELVLCHYYDIGVAVSTERGLMVPVLRNADQMSFAEIEVAIATFARKARENAISVSELQGGTFTITNGGVFGSLLSTPILNPPQSAILGMHKIQERPVVVDGQIVARPMMYLALSYDHRIIDGREAVSFLVKIKEGIENPERLLLGL